MKIKNIEFPCGGRGTPMLLDGGAYDNTGLEALDSNSYQHVFTITINAGGVFVTGGFGKVPLVRELTRANSLLYRQSTTLRTRWMVDRFRAWDSTPPGQAQPEYARQGTLFGLATTLDDELNDECRDFIRAHPEHRTHKDKDLAFYPTVFDKLDRRLVEALVYRGWWLTGATLALRHPGFAPLPSTATPPPNGAD
jgi:NTE family protein